MEKLDTQRLRQPCHQDRNVIKCAMDATFPVWRVFITQENQIKSIAELNKVRPAIYFKVCNSYSCHACFWTVPLSVTSFSPTNRQISLIFNITLKTATTTIITNNTTTSINWDVKQPCVKTCVRS